MAGLSLAVCLLALLLVLPLIILSKARQANVWLAAYVVCLSLISFSEYADAINLYRNYPRLWGWFDLAFSLIGFMYYQYCRVLTGHKLTYLQLWHLFPFFLLFSFISFTHLSVDDSTLRAALYEQSQLPDDNNFWTLIFQTIATAYMLAAIYRVHQFRIKLKEQYSSLRARDFRWLFWITLANISMLLMWFIANESNSGVILQLACRLLLVYALVWYGIKQAPVFLLGKDDETTAAVTANEEKYARSGLTESAADIIQARLKNAMEIKKVFLDADLTLNQLADSIGASPQWLSQYINQYHQCNFFDYVNSFRVREVQSSMRNAGFSSNTLLELAINAGFNSKSTFNASFKKMTGYTPSAWRKQVAETSAPIGLDEILL